MYKKISLSIIVAVLVCFQLRANYILVPMDEKQSNHLKAYGIAYWVLSNDVSMDWLLNYRGGSFLVQSRQSIINELIFFGEP